MSFYKMQRGWQQSGVFGDVSYSERDAWCWIVGAAEWRKDADPISINNKPIKLKRAEFSHSLRFMAKKFGWSTGKVNRFIDKLILWDMLKIKVTLETGQNVLYVCNYNKYQEIYKASGTGSKQGQNASGTKKKKLPKKEEEKNIAKKPNDVSNEVWNDFVAHRKAKKAPLTETAMKGIIREAGKAGWLLEDALIEVCARGWQSFKAEYVEKGANNGNRPNPHEAMLTGYRKANIGHN